MMVLQQTRNVQILEHYHIGRVYQFPRNLMAELVSEIGYSFSDPGKSNLSFLAILRTNLSSV
jgi:hypothetical protein